MVIRINDLNDLEVMNPEEVLTQPGFYYYPLDKRLAVNRESVVINVYTGFNNFTRINNSVNSRSYILIKDEEGKAKAHQLHRIVGYTFIGRPTRHLDKEMSCLEINHINGDRSNNVTSNLEWVTGRENVTHAVKAGLRSDNKTILAKSLDTGEVLSFTSMRECANKFELSPATLCKHLTKSNHPGILHKNGYIFQYSEDGVWVDYPNQITSYDDKNVLGNSTKTFGTIAAIKDGLTIVFDRIQEITDNLSIPYSQLWKRLQKSDSFNLHGYDFKVINRL